MVVVSVLFILVFVFGGFTGVNKSSSFSHEVKITRTVRSGRRNFFIIFIFIWLDDGLNYTTKIINFF